MPTQRTPAGASPWACTSERTVHARSRDQQGLVLQADGPVEAYAFDGPGGPTVIAAALGSAGTAKVVAGEQLRLALAANEVAVWTL